MATELPQEWFLEVQNKKTGPFSTEQILGLLRDGEIPEQARITSDSMLGRWITVRELANAHEVPREPAKPFTPPPRPQDLNTVHEHDSQSAPPPTPADDPASNLFDALQAAKERKAQAGRALPPSSPSKSASDPLQSLKKVPPKYWAMAGAAVVLLLGIWGLLQFIEKKTPPGIDSVRESEPKAAAHARPERKDYTPPPPPAAKVTVSRPAHSYAPPPSRPAPLNDSRSAADPRREEHPEHDAPEPRDVPSEPLQAEASPENPHTPGADAADVAQPNANIQVDSPRHNAETDTHTAAPPPVD